MNTLYVDFIKGGFMDITKCNKESHWIERRDVNNNLISSKEDGKCKCKNGEFGEDYKDGDDE